MMTAKPSPSSRLLQEVVALASFKMPGQIFPHLSSTQTVWVVPIPSKQSPSHLPWTHVLIGFSWSYLVDIRFIDLPNAQVYQLQIFVLEVNRKLGRKGVSGIIMFLLQPWVIENSSIYRVIPRSWICTPRVFFSKLHISRVKAISVKTIISLYRVENF